MNEEDPADLILDVSTMLEQKTRATYCYKTQHALFVRRKSEELGRQVSIPEIVINQESIHRYYPKLTAQNSDWMYDLLFGSEYCIQE